MGDGVLKTLLKVAMSNHVCVLTSSMLSYTAKQITEKSLLITGLHI